MTKIMGGRWNKNFFEKNFSSRVLCVRIEQVEEGSAAQRSGLLPGDAIIRIDGISVNSCTRIECLRLFADAKLLTELVILPVEM